VRITDLHRRLKSQGLSSTVVYVTHDQTEAMTMGDRICVMSAGRIMQVADPKTLYNRPANLFVAGFIGSPEMNLLDGRLDRNGAAAFHLGDQAVPLGPQVTARLHETPAEAVMGIRPQHLKPAINVAAPALSARVASVEFMGHEVYLHADIGPSRVISVVGAADYDAMDRADDHVRLIPDQDWLHIFDKTGGANVSLA
jgi:oligogalacturonide transport system ATP-binding protein